MTNNTAKIESTVSQCFAEFMQKQVTRIERFRRYLCRRQHCEISFDNAVTVWIERGYAAAFRRRFEEHA